jgi:hypothetical protein
MTHLLQPARVERKRAVKLRIVSMIRQSCVHERTENAIVTKLPLEHSSYVVCNSRRRQNVISVDV